jgi:hypothetical protein
MATPYMQSSFGFSYMPAYNPMMMTYPYTNGLGTMGVGASLGGMNMGLGANPMTMGWPMMQQQQSPWMSMLPMLFGALPSLFNSSSSSSSDRSSYGSSYTPSDSYRSRLEATACTDCGRSTYRSRNSDLEPIPPRAYRRPGVGERVIDEGPTPPGTVRARNNDERLAQRSPIWKSFIRNFNRCAPGCEPMQYATYGHRDNLSCHPSGEAIDVHAMVCNGSKYRAIDRGRFEDMVDCMRGKMVTLYRNGWHKTKGHHDHAHFSNGCIDRGRRVY